MRKKRRKAVYVPYDYEAAYMNSLDKMEEANEERILKEGKVKSIYATKEIRSGDQLEVEIYPEFTKGQKDQIPDEGKRKRQRQAQKNLNDKNSKKMCERVIGENFTDRDIWATFTYTDDNMPASMEVATKNMQNYIRRLNYQRKKQGLSNARYVYVTECSEKGRWHHHIVMDGDVDMDTVEAVWNLGKRNEIRRLQRDENGLVGMARYITKEKSKKGKYQKTWCASKGLRKPKEKVNHYKTKQKDVDRIVKGDLNVCDHLMKWYGDKYDFTEAEVKYNTFNGRFYIYGRMRLRKGTAHDKGKKGKYQKTWCASKGLRKPKEKVNHYKTKQKDVDRIVKGDLNVCDHLMKWYGDKYDFTEAEVKYNTFNGRFYIYGRMRLRKGTAHDKGKK